MTTHREPLESVLETVGETPLVRVQASPDDVPVYAKLESFNPGASIKDRLGVYLVEKHLERGDIEPGGTVIEPTAGNTGIGIALAATQMDVEAEFVVPERFSVEKQTLMRSLGATIVNTPTEEGMKRAIEVAHERAERKDNAIVPQQFASPLNAAAHEATTGPEIWDALDGEVGAVVAGCGTAGTLMGIAGYISERQPDVHVTAVEPEGSLFARTKGADVDHEEYNIEGIGTSDLGTNELFDESLVDEVRQVSDRAAQEELKRLAREEGQLVASSAGAASVAARDVADRIADGDLDVPHETVVTVFPDSSERYLSKGIYDEYEEWVDD
ncbi:cystathionine beta-synthase (acetylserine-dependent) [Halovenus aranensis]|jgi:cysteine synthase A|uniref:Cystathionine beta-synthase (Acetylserine-dependent) n=1 Tax=Halovenus aranensis TaxID=890420 RepID=A0A1G8UBT6_9EURY|nr:PLP-dependent cysteine synthase family protein [Halovenus aranensis]SDJ51229.1 cystathionine beta-synthase (acetylserine-dependent) [Halovenus aranensis]